jgi:hypothetical protein
MHTRRKGIHLGLGKIRVYKKGIKKKKRNKGDLLAKEGGIELGVCNLLAIRQFLWMFQRMILESE